VTEDETAALPTRPVATRTACLRRKWQDWKRSTKDVPSRSVTKFYGLERYVQIRGTGYHSNSDQDEGP